MDGQVSAIFLCARGILGLELLGEEDLFKGACQDHPGFAFEVLNDEDLGSVPGNGGLVVGGHAGGPLFEAPLARAGYDLRIDTGEVIGSGLYWNHSWPHLSCFPGRDPGTPSERPGPRRARRASAAAT